MLELLRVEKFALVRRSLVEALGLLLGTLGTKQDTAHELKNMGMYTRTYTHAKRDNGFIAA